MEAVLETIKAIGDSLIDIISLIPEVLTLPVVLLIVILIFRNEISLLLESISVFFKSKPKESVYRAPLPQPAPAITPQAQPHQISRETSTQVHQSLAQAYALKGSYDDAVAQYQAAISVSPDNASAYIGLGNAYYKKGMHSEAIKALEKAVEIKPYWADCRCNLGAAYSLASLHDKAIEEFNQAIRINSSYSAAHYGLGIAFISAGKYDKAAQQVEKLKELDSSFADKLAKSLEDAQAHANRKQEAQQEG